MSQLGPTNIRTAANTVTSATGTEPILVNGVAGIQEVGDITISLDSPLAEIYGGTHQSTYTLGDTLYSSATNTLSKLAGNTQATLMVLSQLGDGTNSAAPVWIPLPTTSSSIYMFANIASSIATYFQAVLSALYTPGALGTASATVTTTPTFIVAFATNSGFPNLTNIPPGLFVVHYETQKNTGGNSYYSYAEIYKRNLAGTETLLLTSDNSTTTTSNTVQQITVTVYNPSNITLLSTDRIVVKIWAVMGVASNTITVFWDDATSARLEIPVSSSSTTISATAPLTANGVSGTFQSGAVTLAISGSGYVSSISGTANQINASASTGAVTLSLSSTIITPGTLAINGLITGSVLFSGPSSVVSQNNAQFFWDNTNNRLGIGTTAPNEQLTISAAIGAMNIISNIAGTGNLKFAATGGNVYIEAGASTTADSKANLLFTSMNAGTEWMRLTNAGLFGIGCTPVNKLDVNGAVAIGAYAGVNTAPSNGLIISGQTGHGIASVEANSLTTATIANFRRAFYVGGTNTSSAGFDTYSSYMAIGTWAPSAGNTNYITDFISNSKFAAPSAASLTGVLACFYASPIVNTNVGTINNLYGFIFDGGSAATGTVTTTYGGYFTLPLSGTNKHALHADNMSIGSSYVTSSTPPTNGLIVQGAVSIGTTGTSGSLTLNLASTGIIFYIGATASTTTNAVNNVGIYNQCTLSTSAATTTSYGMLNAPTFSVSGAGTYGNAYGAQFNCTGTASATNIYSVYINRPSAGTNKIALYSDEIAVGYTGTAPPSNGMIIRGQLGVGDSAPGGYFSRILSPASTSYSIVTGIGGTPEGTTGLTGANDTAGLYVFPITKPSGTSTNTMSIYVYPQVDASLATSTTVPTSFGILVAGGGLASGTVNTAYGMYASNPSFGTKKIAFYADNASIGYAATTPISSGMIVNGGIAIGTTSLEFPTTSLLQVGDSSRASSNYIVVEATNAVDKGIAYSSSGAIRCYTILPGGNQNFWQLTTGVQCIGVDLVNARTMIGTGTAVNKLDVNGAVAIGSYAGVNTAPSNTCMASGGFISGSGTAGSPGFTWFVDNNAGMYYTSNTLNFSTASTRRAYIDSNGITIPSPGLLITDNGTSSGGILHWALRSTGSVLRAGIGLQNTETGSNAGSNWNLYTYKDDGSFLGNPITVIRSSGTVGINTGSSATTSSIFHALSTYAYGIYTSGTQTGVDGATNSASIYVNPTLNPTNGSTISAGIYDVPLLATPTGKTITVAAGQYINVDTGSNVGVIGSLIPLYIGLGNLTVNGTIQNAYGVYISQPLASATGNYYALAVQGGQIWHYTSTSTSETENTSRTIVGVTSTAAARTITLPATPPDAGWIIIIKDQSGGAATNNITVAGNGHNIDGAANYTINTNYGSVMIYSNGTQYYTMAKF